MTTIAYRDGIMASDTQNTYDGMKIIGSRKLFIGKNSILGYAGNPQFVAPYTKWWSEVESLEADPRNWVYHKEIKVDDMMALLYHREYGLFFLHDDGYAEIQPHEFFAIGSGACFAFAAMDGGASAPKAVRVAIKYDLYSGGDVEAARFDA